MGSRISPPALSQAAASGAFLPLPSGTPEADQVPVVTTADPLALEWGAGGGGGLLAHVSHANGSANYTTTSSSYVDVSAANLVVTFTAPASGHVVVVVDALLGQSSANPVFLNLRDASGDIAGTGRYVKYGSVNERAGCRIGVSGLTPGQSYTWKLGWKVTGGAGGTATMHQTSSDYAATMDVLAVVGDPT